MASSDTQEIDLFLIGKTGHGKSSTGNAILGREAFAVSDRSVSETYIVQAAWARRRGRLLKVVDGPGLCETRLDRGAAAKKMVVDMSQGVTQCPQGFHALMLVLKYGNRFTEEELSVVTSLKSLFGQEFVRDFCIIVFTHGELYDMNYRRNPRPFADWCREQDGALKTLLTECGYRAMLFYNVDEEKAEPQIDELISIVDGLSSNGARYTNEMFARVAEEREALIVRENAPYLREAIQAKIDLLIDGVNSVKDATELDEATRTRLELVKKDARDLEVEISVQDKGTGVLDSLRQVVVNLNGSLVSHENALKEKGNREERERELEAARQKYNEDLKRLQEQVNKRKKRNFWQKLGDTCVNFISGKLFSTVLDTVKDAIIPKK